MQLLPFASTSSIALPYAKFISDSISRSDDAAGSRKLSGMRLPGFSVTL